MTAITANSKQVVSQKYKELMAHSNTIHIFKDAQSVAEAVAQKLYELVCESNKPFHLALSGGSTPTLLFDCLATDYAEKIPWDRIHFWWGDERCVLPTDNESNFKTTETHLFQKIEIDKAQIHRIKGELVPGKAAIEYQDEIFRHVPQKDNIPIFDLIILGMGTDGHTASIFPHEMELLRSKQICAVATHPNTGQKRVTLTGQVLNHAERIFFLVTGPDKKERVADIILKKEGAEKLPSFHIRPKNGKLVFYLDTFAAAGLSAKQ